MTALRKKMFRMRLLTITAADFCARDLRRNGQHRNAATVAIVKSIDEMQVARPAATGADGEPPGQMRLGACGECSSLLVSEVYPLDVVSGRIDLVIPFSESPATL
jgi:hypothetical protein